MKSKKVTPAGAGMGWSTAARVASLTMAAAFCAAVHGELIGFYPFDGADPMQDDSGKGANLQSAGADPAYAPEGGVEGGGYVFNGFQRLVAPIDISPLTLPQVTMGAWVKTSNLDSGLRKIMGSDDGEWDRTIGLDNRDGPFRYTSFSGTSPCLGAPGPVSTNEWTFIAVTYDETTAQLSLYVDLEAVTTEPLSPVTLATVFGSGFQSVAIGGLRPDNADEGWQGSIDNVFFYDEALTAERLTEIRNGGRRAILGLPGEDPDLIIGAGPDLEKLNKVPSVKTLSYPIRNAGAAKPIQISRVTITGADATYFSVQSFTTNLAAGATGTIEFKLDSKGQVGRFYATATVESNDPTTPVVLLELNARVSAAQTLLGFYTFDDPANPLKDDSGGGRTLANGLDGGAADPTYLPSDGFSGGAFDFNGTQRLVAPLNINPTVQPRLAMGAWVKTSSLESGMRKVLGHDDGAWDRVIGLDYRAEAAGGEMPAGTLRYVAFTGGNNHGPTQGDPPPTPVSTDAWTFLAADYDQANNRISLYVDLDASTTEDEPQVIVHETQMGAGAATTSVGSITPGGSGEGWLGAIDNVFFVSGALDAAAMRAVRDDGKKTLLQFGPDPVLAVLTDKVFGKVPDNSTRTAQVQIRNGGLSQTLGIVSARIVGLDAACYSVGALPNVAPGATASIPVTLTPGSRLGILQATLELTSNDNVDRKTLIDLGAEVPFTSLQAALIGFYPFDDPANPMKDASGKGNDLVSAGADPVYQASEGFESGSYLYDGTQRLVAPININPSERPALTMGAWVKLGTLESGLRKVIGSDDGGWDRTIGLDNREDGVYRYTAFPGNGGPVAGTPEPVSTDAWTFLAATFDQAAANVTVYVDLDASTKTDALVAVSRANSVYGSGFSTASVGSLRPDNANEGFVGGIDNVFFYSKVLTLEDLTKLRDGGKGAIVSETPSIQISSVKLAGGALTLTWGSSGSTTYTIEYTQALGGSWVSIGTQTSQGATTSFTDSSTERMGRSTGFYRISVK